MIYKTEPENFKKEIEVTGCYIEHSNKFLLLHRLDHKTNGNRLGFPAGKLDVGEDLEQAMIREIKEETGLDITTQPLKFINSVYIRNEGHDLMFHMFKLTLLELPEISINPNEHKAYYWLTIEEALQREDLIHDLNTCLENYYMDK